MVLARGVRIGVILRARHEQFEARKVPVQRRQVVDLRRGQAGTDFGPVPDRGGRRALYANLLGDLADNQLGVHTRGSVKTDDDIPLQGSLEVYNCCEAAG
jgi:hypothetical protein